MFYIRYKNINKNTSKLTKDVVLQYVVRNKYIETL